MLRYLSFLLLLFVVAAVFRVDFYFTVAFLFFALYALARLWVRQATPQVEIRRQYIDRAFHGDQVTVQVDVRNHGRLPLTWLQMHESLPVPLRVAALREQVISLDPGASHRMAYTLHCFKRGVYQLGPLTVRSGDVFGLIPAPAHQAPPARLIVYPRVVPVQRLGLPTRSPLIHRPARLPLFEDPARVVSVRAYAPGDPLRRLGALQVKGYQPADSRETMICLDLGSTGYGARGRMDATELAISGAASLANHIIVDQRLAAGLTVHGQDALTGERTEVSLPIRRERAHLMAMLEALARAESTEEADFLERLAHQRLTLPWGTSVIVITGRAGPEWIDVLAQLQRANLPTALVITQPEQIAPVTRERAARLRIPLHLIWRERDLEAGL
jgi:uncharacterized protein (DUF58 family)